MRRDRQHLIERRLSVVRICLRAVALVVFLTHFHGVLEQLVLHVLDLALAAGARKRVQVDTRRFVAIDVDANDCVAGITAHGLVNRTVLLLEGLPAKRSTVTFAHLHASIDDATLRHEAASNEVLTLAIRRVSGISSRGDSFHAFDSGVVLTLHLLVEQLSSHAIEVGTLLLQSHTRVLSHVDKSTIEDDLSLRILLRTLKTISLNLALLFESLEQAFSVKVNVAKDHTLEPLMVSECQLLDSDVVLLRNAHRKSHLSWRPLDRLERRWNRLAGWRLVRLSLAAATRLSNRLERHILDSHGHWDRIENLLEWFGLQRLRNLSKSVFHRRSCDRRRW